MAVAYAASRYASQMPEEPRVVLSREALPSRLDVCVPHLHKDYVFGGLASVLALGRHLSRFYETVRFVSLAPLPEPDRCLDGAAFVEAPDRRPVEVTSVAGGRPISFHPRDVLLCSYWPTVRLWERQAALRTEAGLPPNRFYYCIQDWEPGFSPMGVKHMLAEATYRHGDVCQAVINSTELAHFFGMLGYRFGTSVVVKPSLNPALAAVLDASGRRIPAKATDVCNVLVYGRPEQPRNCFAAILAGIDAYAAVRRPDGPPVRFVSAGIAHEDVAFAGGIVLTSLGTLSLREYAGVLLQSHVGIALMASPHPSYPPLEMACFGLEVVTNAYRGKDLSKAHPRIHSIPGPRPKLLAAELARAIDLARQRAGRETDVLLPETLSPEPWEGNFRHAGVPVIRV